MRIRDVRFLPLSGHARRRDRCLLCASNRHPENRKRGTDRKLHLACIINLEFFQLSQKRVMPARLQHLQTRTADYFSNVIGTSARWMTFMATEPRSRP